MSRAAAAALCAAALCAAPPGAAASRSEMVGDAADAAAAWPRLVQPQPVYVELPEQAAARKANPEDASLPVPLMVAADVMLTGGCLKLIAFNAEASVPPLDHAFARTNGTHLLEHLLVTVDALGIRHVPLQAVHVGSGREVPVLGVLCAAALEDAAEEVEVLFHWTGPVPAQNGSSVSTGRRQGTVRVFRTVPDVDASDELPGADGSEPAAPAAGAGKASPIVGLCAHFTLDAATGTGWAAHWSALGVNRFVLYFNGRFDALEESEAAQLRTLLAAHPNITLVEWPFPYALQTAAGAAATPEAPLSERVALVAAPMAATHCAHAFGGAVDYLLFTDSKDYGVVPSVLAAEAAGEPPLARVGARPLQALLAGVQARYAPPAAAAVGAGAGAGVGVVGLPTFWAATSPSAQGIAALEMGVTDAATVQRIRGDLYSTHFLRVTPLLRHATPAAGEGKVALARAALGSVTVVCVHGPCGARHVHSVGAAAAAATAASAQLLQVNVSAADGYLLRLANAGVPFMLSDDPARHAAVVANATVLDAPFRAHVRAAAAATGAWAPPKAAAAARPPAPPSTPPHLPATCAATAGVGSVPPAVARLHTELTKSQLHPECDHEHRRFLVFTYAEEQSVNGFAAMFQFYAGALALAHATGRTLVELLPPPLNGSSSSSSSSATAPYTTRRSLVESADAHDPWQRAPARACHGAKMGCFFQPHAACALTGVLPASLPHFDWSAELRRLGRARSPPHRRQRAQQQPPGESEGDDSEAATGGGLLKAHRKQLAPALARVVRLDSIARVRPALLAATRGDLAPGWFRAEAAAWACDRCGASSLALLAGDADAGAGAGAGGVSGCTPTDAAALADHCSAYCASGGPDAAWRRLWFPALQAWLFRPADAILNATAHGVAQVVAPAGSVAVGGGAGGGDAPAADVPLEPRAATAGLLGGDGSGGGGAAAGPATLAPAPAPAAVRSSAHAAAGAVPPPREHVAIGVHFRAGDASGLVWRSHAPLTSYLHTARALVRSLDRRARLLAAGAGGGGGAALDALNDTAVHVSLAFASDSDAALRGVRRLAYDRLAGASAPLFDPATRRVPVAAAGGGGANASAEPLLALLDSGAHALMETDERTRTVAGVLRGLLADKTALPLGAVAFHRLVTSGAATVTKSDSELAQEAAAAAAAARAKAANATNATNATSAGAGAGAGSSSAAAAPAPPASPPPPVAPPHELPPRDKVVHLETHIAALLAGARPKVLLAADSDADAGADDDVFPSKELDDARLAPLAAGSYAAWEGAGAVGSGEAAQVAAAQQVAALTAGVVGDVWLLSHAHFLIGTCLSQVSRLAAELQLAAGRARGPPVGLDARLCRAFPMPAPYTVLADWREAPDAWLSDE